ncbi:MAG: DUF6316 family protein [Pseudohongiellaceae bacterium]
MPDTRSEDRPQTRVPSRSDRLFSNEELWYFRTREGDSVGPFRYRSEAQSGLKRFIDQLRSRNTAS